MDTCSCVHLDGVMSDWFAVGTGVRQRCRIVPDLFLGLGITGHFGDDFTGPDTANSVTALKDNG